MDVAIDIESETDSVSEAEGDGSEHGSDTEKSDDELSKNQLYIHVNRLLCIESLKTVFVILYLFSWMIIGSDGSIKHWSEASKKLVNSQS